MKLYKTTATHEGETKSAWSGSQADAAKDRKHFNSDKKIPRAEIVTEEVEAPTNKQGLLDFLNGAS